MSLSPTELSIKQQLATLSPAKRALLELKLMKKSGRDEAAREVIPRRTERGPAPLSGNQQGLWVLSQLLPDTWLYQIPKAVRLTGKLNVLALKQSLDFIVARHESLRTTFAMVDEVPSQIIAEHLSLEMPTIDLGHLAETDREAEAQRIIDTEGRRPFELSHGPLIRSLLLRLGEEEHILLVTTHHIVTDGWSMGIFQRELTELYAAFAAGRPSPLPELPIQYSDYACWHQRWLEGSAYETQLAYWKQQFATLPPALELPTDHPRAAVHAYRAYSGNQQTLSLSKDLTRRLKNFCQTEAVTPFMMLLAAYEILLHRYTGEEDIVVGTPIAGRRMAEMEPLIGLFINVLALRVSVSGNPTFRELLRRVKEAALGGYANQDLPFETLVREIHPDRTLSHNPIFQVMFVLQNEPMPPMEFGGLRLSDVLVNNVTTNFDLTLDIVERDKQFLIKFECNADLFEKETIARMMGHFETLLAGIVAHPEQRIFELPLLSEPERRELLVEWNDTKTDYPANQCVHELFEDQVNRTPEATALVFEDQQLTYRELNRQANQLANYLRTLGVGPDVLVGVRMERSARLVIALLGIVKAGGAYLPLDLAYPKERVEFMLADAQAPVLLTEQKLASDILETSAKIVCLDESRDRIAEFGKEPPANLSTADNLIYVIYTSGSTGVPKGVSVTHRAVNRLVFNTNYVELTSDDRVAQTSNSSFDAATFEIWGALLHGAQLIGITKEVALSPKHFAEEIQSKQISMMFLTTALFNQIARDAPRAFSSMRQLMFGGEAVDPNWVREVMAQGPPQRLIHVYGPTESTTFSTWHLIESVPEGAVTIPIGRPLSNTTAYIVDKHFNPVPVGVPGELYVGGDGLAREYLNRPELSHERFVPNPFSAGKEARLYKTGDIVRYLADGSIEFVGRKDYQVKIRGFRIELGEIEAALVEHPEVAESAVTVSEDQFGDKRLTAYFVPAQGKDITTAELRDSLRQKLPEYMVPAMFVALEALPLSPNGKVDRRALPAVEGINQDREADFVAPQDDLELKLAKTWERALGIRPISIDDNFFDLGGHSLLAVRLFGQIEKLFGRNLPLATLFRAPTVRQLARVLREEVGPAPWSSLVPIQPNGSKQPFFCIHAAGGNVLEYRDLARLLGPDQPFYGLQARGLNGEDEPHTSIKEMAAHYLKEMHEVQPEGPYLIGGRSSGGTIAFEMACQLAEAGEEVALLALLDTYPAGYFKLLPGSRGGRASRNARKIQSHISNLRQLGIAEQAKYILEKLSYAPAKAKHKIFRRAYKIYRSIGRPLPPVLKNIEELNFAAVKDYVPQVYPGPAALFLANDLTSGYDVEEGWEQLVAALEVHEISGNHLDIIKEPHVQVLAEKLNGCLERAHEQMTPSARP
jgi:amino acid adenylation domain-containing protein